MLLISYSEIQVVVNDVFYISFARWEPHRGKGFNLFLFLFVVAPVMPLRSALAHGDVQQRAQVV